MALLFEGAAGTLIVFLVLHHFVFNAIDGDSILHAGLPLLFKPSECIFKFGTIFLDAITNILIENSNQCFPHLLIL